MYYEYCSVLTRRGFGYRHLEDTGRRQLSTSQGEGASEETNRPDTSISRLLASRILRK